jgi:hypothetical protein
MIVGYPDSPTLVISHARRAASAHAFVAAPRILSTEKPDLPLRCVSQNPARCAIWPSLKGWYAFHR